MKKFTKLTALTLVLVMSVVLLASCSGPAKKPSDAESALKDNGYTVVVDTVVATHIWDGLNAKVTATKKNGDDLEYIAIYYFTDKDAANAAWEKMQDESESEKEDEDDSDWVVKKSGSIIYYGTEDAVKASK